LDAIYSFLEQHDIYVVLVIVLAIWALLYFYLVRLEKKIGKIEESTERSSSDIK
jgi:hypothetical protein